MSRVSSGTESEDENVWEHGASLGPEIQPNAVTQPSQRDKLEALEMGFNLSKCDF